MDGGTDFHWASGELEVGSWELEVSEGRNPRSGGFEIEEGFFPQRVRKKASVLTAPTPFGMPDFLFGSGDTVRYSDLRVVARLVWMAWSMTGRAAAIADAAMASRGRSSIWASVGRTW